MLLLLLPLRHAHGAAGRRVAAAGVCRAAGQSTRLNMCMTHTILVRSSGIKRSGCAAD